MKLLRELEEELSALNPTEIHTFDTPLILMLLSDLRCNLRCRYCYTASGSYFTKTLSDKQVMDLETAKKALDIGIELGINQVHFFGGGEALLNFEIIKGLVKYAEAQNYPVVFAMITNGTKINKDFIEFVEQYKDIFNITVSIDGPKLIHDLNRNYPNGKGSFEDTLRGIEMLKERKLTFELQVTYPIEAEQFGYGPKEIANYLSTLSPFLIVKICDYHEQFNTGERPFHGMLGYLMMEYISDVFEKLKSTTPQYYDHNLAITLSYIARRATKLYPCPFSHFVTVLPDGKLLTCHMIVDYLLGTVNSSKTELLNKLKKAVEFNKKFSTLLDYHDFWHAGLQDICPSELFGGLTNVLTKTEKLRLSKFSKSMLEAYWDSVLFNVYKSYKENTLQKVYSNLEYFFETLYKQPRVQ